MPTPLPLPPPLLVLLLLLSCISPPPPCSPPRISVSALLALSPLPSLPISLPPSQSSPRRVRHFHRYRYRRRHRHTGQLLTATTGEHQWRHLRQRIFGIYGGGSNNSRPCRRLGGARLQRRAGGQRSRWQRGRV